jgi:SAM-dependent methyltransferase
LAPKKQEPNWDERYRQPGRFCGEDALDFLREYINELPSGDALDLAAGEGRNAVFLAQKGYRVTAIEKSPVGIAKAAAWAKEAGVELDLIEADLENYSLPEEAFDLVFCSNYTQRSLFPQMERALRTGGALMIQTYTVEQAGRERGPKNPEFLLQPNELYRTFRHLRVAYYREVDDGHRAIASLLAYRW